MIKHPDELKKYDGGDGPEGEKANAEQVPTQEASAEVSQAGTPE